MRMARNLRISHLRATAAALFATLIALLAGATSALACTLPPPFDGEVMSYRLAAGPNGDPFVTWSEYRPGVDDAKRAAVLSGGVWAWVEPASAPAPDAQGLPPGRVVEAGGNAVAVWQQNQAIVAASRHGAGAFGLGLVIAEELVAPFGGISMNPTVDLGAGGHAVAVWTRMQRDPTIPGIPKVDRRVVRAADRAPNGTWSEPYDLAAPGAEGPGR